MAHTHRERASSTKNQLETKKMFGENLCKPMRVQYHLLSLFFFQGDAG